MYRTFSVAVSVAVMLLKKRSVERFCKTKIRTKFRDSPCESVYEFLHELCVLHIFVVCAGKCTYAMTRSHEMSYNSSFRVPCKFRVQSCESSCEVLHFMTMNESLYAFSFCRTSLVTHLFHTRRVNELVWLRIFRCRRNLFVCLLEKLLYSLVIK